MVTKTRVIRLFLCLVLGLTTLFGLTGGLVAFAANEEVTASLAPSLNQEGEESLLLLSPYPVLQDRSGSVFDFTVILDYKGAQPKVFDLSTDIPAGSYAMVVSALESRGIASIRLDPELGGKGAVSIRFNPLLRTLPPPGEYTFTFTARSGNLAESITLKAVVTAKYEFLISPGTGRYNTDIMAGNENHVSVVLRNSSSVALEEIALYAAKPEGWSATFVPDKVDSIPAGTERVLDLILTPPRNTIAGDYEITVRAETKEIWDEMDLRTTVQTPTIWGWVAILIVVGVVAGLGLVFRQLGRR